MTDAEKRLECLKLAMRRDRSIEDVIKDAKQMEEYLNNGTRQTTLGLPAGPRKGG